MKNIIYLKEYKIDRKCSKLKLFWNKIIYYYRRFFNIITKEEINGYNIWMLPINGKYSINKLRRVMQKCQVNDENIFLIENKLRTKDMYLNLKEVEIKIYNNELIKKVLLDKVLEYITRIQKKQLNEIEVTVLADTNSEINVFLIKELAIKTKSLKIVSSNIYKFKNIEEVLYSEHGVALQFSNSYRKSLLKSEIIVNLDFDKLKINEYNINNKAIIINCTKDDLSIKNKIFNGVVVNSYKLNIKKELIDEFVLTDLLEKYENLDLYGSRLLTGTLQENIKQIKKDKISINSLIGNNGVLDKREFIKKA